MTTTTSTCSTEGATTCCPLLWVTRYTCGMHPVGPRLSFWPSTRTAVPSPASTGLQTASISLLGSTLLKSNSGTPAPTDWYVPASSKNAVVILDHAVVEFRSFFPCSWELSEVCMKQELARWHGATASSPLAAWMARSWTTTWELGTMLCRHTRGTVMRCVGLSGLDQGHNHGWHQFLVSQLSSPISNPPFFFCLYSLCIVYQLSPVLIILSMFRDGCHIAVVKTYQEKKDRSKCFSFDVVFFFLFLLQATLLLDAFSKNRASFSRHD